MKKVKKIKNLTGFRKATQKEFNLFKSEILKDTCIRLFYSVAMSAPLVWFATVILQSGNNKSGDYYIQNILMMTLLYGVSFLVVSYNALILILTLTNTLHIKILDCKIKETFVNIQHGDSLMFYYLATVKTSQYVCLQKIKISNDIYEYFESQPQSPAMIGYNSLFHIIKIVPLYYKEASK